MTNLADSKKKRIHPDTILINGIVHVNAKRLSEIIGVGEHYIRRISREVPAKLPHHRIGSKVWYDPEKIKRYIGINRQLKINYEVLKGF